MSETAHFDLHDLEHLFDDGTPQATRGASTWTITFSSGDYAGFTLTLNGTDLPTGGTDPLPNTGTISDITLAKGEVSIFAVSGLSLPASRLYEAADLEHDHEDDPEHAEDDDIVCGGADDDVHGGKGRDAVHGGKGSDRIDGGDGDDTLEGEDDDDHLSGGTGNDDLRGGMGRDKLYGGSGKDILWGGEDADRFVFRHKSDSGVSAKSRDVVADFQRGDKIDLSAIDASAKKAGNQSFKFVSHFSGKAGELQWDKNAKGFYVSGDLNGDKHADFSVQVNTLLAKIHASDFVL